MRTFFSFFEHRDVNKMDLKYAKLTSISGRIFSLFSILLTSKPLRISDEKITRSFTGMQKINIVR